MTALNVRSAAHEPRGYVCNPVALTGMPEVDGEPVTPRLQGARCQCTECGDFFASVRAFDRHRIGRFAKAGQLQGTRRCMTQAELDAAGFARNAYGCRCEPPRVPTHTHGALEAARAPYPVQPHTRPTIGAVNGACAGAP